MDWRDKFRTEMPEEPEGLPLQFQINLRLSSSGSRVLTSHAETMGISRQQWIRDAITEKLTREGVEFVPEMRPYTGHRLLRSIEW